jgi:uncharacterized sodium:solute symporter family permease YidK
VQRYLSGKSLREMQMGLVFNGIVKIPMQFFILLVGVMVFVFFQFNSAPLNFNPIANKAVKNSVYANDYALLEAKQLQIEAEKKTANLAYGTSLENEALKQKIQDINARELENRTKAITLIQKADATVETNDKDYVFIHFILHYLPRGLIGLLLAVILSAGMSSTASELNALAATTTIDLYKRNVTSTKSDMHYVKASKWFTLLWGIIAISVANVANLFDNLIQLVNIIGSIFYGNVLGIFLLAFFIKYVRGNAVFVAALITQIVVIIGWYYDWMPYLWLNLFGSAMVMSLAIMIQFFTHKK